ncbi:MAG: glutathione synthetase [Algoriphagus sp.]|uniref:ATP-grasp domain-containing protein n=1 Tax=Algoriphagus sp. TaxID=1872435 RepID=UPI002627F70E|nr:glutathione synthetase [Algoriphagus sp.]MDG1276392.1 glutathione synthetase [Algoriphagus sp.]
MQKPVAIVSYFSVGAYDTNTVDEDKILSQVLTELNIPNEIVPWSTPDEDWSRFSFLLIKSVWDYFDFYLEFLDWVKHIKSLDLPVLNDLDSILWNSDKTYLLEIQEKGFPVIAGKLLEKGTKFNGEAFKESMKSDTWVIKPLVSGGAKNTLKIKANDWKSQEKKINDLLQTESFLIQPFIKEVAEVGEYSLIFFNGKFSHTVLKTPAKDDFRVQHYFGGTIATIQPSAKMLDSCQKLVDEFASDSLYVRVDGVEVDGVFHLMELEMIEPYLFLVLDEKAIPNYKEALRERLK